MLKRLTFKYWPLVLLLILIGAILGMSRYAENRKAGDQSKTQSSNSQQGGGAPNDAGKGTQSTNKIHQNPDWIDTFTWPEGATVWALLLTLIVIAWQSAETRAAADGVEKQSALMKRQADAMEIQNRDARERERAKLVIRHLETPELYPAGSTMNGDRALKVRVVVENLGGSRAFNVRAWGMIDIVSDRLGDNYDVGIQQVFPSIIDVNQQKHFLNVSGLGREFEGVATVSDYQAIPEELGQRIRNGEVFIVASGNLAYEDIFLDTYETPFHFVWHSFGNDDGGIWLTESYWLDRSERPRRVHAEQENKPRSPN